MKKQSIAKLLVLVMVLTMVPVTILAASAANAGTNSAYYTIYEDTTVRVDGAIKATVVGGKATVALSAKAVESLAEMVKDGAIVLEIEAEGATKIDVTFPAQALTAVAKETGADLTIKSSVATITIPNEILSSEFASFGTVRISAQNSEDSVGFSIQAGGKALKNTDGIKVEF